MNRLLVVEVLFLLVSSSVISISGVDTEQSIQQLSSGKTLYVGGSGPNNYTKIQDAIDDASNGDTVIVYNDSSPYREDIKVDKSINLIGEDRDTTIIDGKRGTVMELSADWVNISGFTIRNGDSAGIWIGCFGESNNNIIYGNTITLSTVWGIYLESSNNNTISDNIINLNNDSGITLYQSYNNTIIGNNISKNKVGGPVLYESANNSIIDNTITSNNIDGIIIDTYSNNNMVFSNIISNNNYGLWVSFYSNYNNITGNNIHNNKIGIFLGKASYNEIESNNFIENRIQASFGKSKKNVWNENYWDNWIGFKINMSIFQKFPKAIVGLFGINFDWHPAQEPYDMEV